jgi:hypothetical protein
MATAITLALLTKTWGLHIGDLHTSEEMGRESVFGV